MKNKKFLFEFLICLTLYLLFVSINDFLWELSFQTHGELFILMIIPSTVSIQLALFISKKYIFKKDHNILLVFYALILVIIAVALIIFKSTQSSYADNYWSLEKIQFVTALINYGAYNIFDNYYKIKKRVEDLFDDLNRFDS